MTIPANTPPTGGSFYLTKQALLDLFDRIIDDGYMDPIKKIGPGYEIFEAYAMLWERISIAIANLDAGAFVLSAEGGRFSTGSIDLSRPTGVAGGVIVKRGTVVMASASTRKFVTTEDIKFIDAMDLGPYTVPIRATAQSYNWNLRGQVTTADGTLLAGEIDTIFSLIEEPPFADQTIVVTQILPTIGGQPPALDQLGSDREILRAPTESDELYRKRITALPDNVSPDAIRRAVQIAFGPYPFSTFDIIETWNITYQTCWDGPPATFVGSSYDPNLFCFDDPRPASPFRNRWLDEREFRGAFIVVVDNLPAIEDSSFIFYDDADTGVVDMLPTDRTTVYGRRATSAFDIPDTADPIIYLACALEGMDLPKRGFYISIFDLLQRIKAGGVAAIVELRGQ